MVAHLGPSFHRPDFPWENYYNSDGTPKNIGGPSIKDCFIATTVYGDPDAHEVNVLRRFRDEVLMESPGGRAFVAVYYGGLGQRTAEFVRNHVPRAIPVIRSALDHLVAAYDAKKR